MSNPMSDQLADLTEEDQQQFHEHTQRHLRRQWAEAKAKTEREYDEQERRN